MRFSFVLSEPPAACCERLDTGVVHPSSIGHLWRTIARAVAWEPRKVKSWSIRNGEGKIDQHHEWPALNMSVPARSTRFGLMACLNSLCNTRQPCSMVGCRAASATIQGPVQPMNGRGCSTRTFTGAVLIVDSLSRERYRGIGCAV
jgi:hypothetical protein